MINQDLSSTQIGLSSRLTLSVLSSNAMLDTEFLHDFIIRGKLEILIKTIPGKEKLGKAYLSWENFGKLSV